MSAWIYPTVTNTAAAVTGLPATRKYLIVHNPSATGSMAFTLDGVTPVINGAGITLLPYGSVVLDQYTNDGTITAISSIATQTITIGWR